MTIITLSMLLVALPNPTNIIIHRQQEALAQINDDNSTFKVYENPTFAIRMQYPSDWEKVEPGQISYESSFNIIVGFVSPKESVSDTSPLPAQHRNTKFIIFSEYYARSIFCCTY